MRLKTISSIAATWVVIIAPIAGGYHALMAYKQSVAKQPDNRAAASMEFVKLFASQQMLPIRGRIYEAIHCYACAKDDISNTEVFAFVEFFDNVSVCVEANVCDKKIIASVFSPYATGHFKCLKPFIESVRRGEETLKLPISFGHGLEFLREPFAERRDECANFISFGDGKPVYQSIR